MEMSLNSNHSIPQQEFQVAQTGNAGRLDIGVQPYIATKDLQDDIDTLTRKRNRLAQRKHRSCKLNLAQLSIAQSESCTYAMKCTVLVKRASRNTTNPTVPAVASSNPEYPQSSTLQNHSNYVENCGPNLEGEGFRYVHFLSLHSLDQNYVPLSVSSPNS